MFSPEAFQELDLHPHLVSIAACSGGLVLVQSVSALGYRSELR